MRCSYACTLTSCLVLLIANVGTVQAQVVVTLGDNPIGIDDGLTLDSEGNLLGSSFVNGANGRVRRVTPDGLVSIYTDEISGPLGHDFDANGDLYTASFYENLLYRVHPDGSSEEVTNEIVRPSGVVVGPDGNIYIAAYGFSNNPGDKIYRVTPGGTVEVLATSAFFNGPVGIDFDELGNLYVGSYNRGYITRVTMTGEVELLATVPGPNTFNTGYICYSNGSVYATGIGTNKVYRLFLDTLELVDFAGDGVAGLVDGDAAVARFNQPNGLVASATGDTLYVSEYGNKTVRMIISGDTSAAPDVVPAAGTGLRLEQSVPNPTVESAEIGFSLPQPSTVLLQVFDVRGREVARLAEGPRAAGSHSVRFPTSALASGVYNYRLQIGPEIVSRRMTVVH